MGSSGRVFPRCQTATNANGPCRIAHRVAIQYGDEVPQATWCADLHMPVTHGVITGAFDVLSTMVDRFA